MVQLRLTDPLAVVAEWSTNDTKDGPAVLSVLRDSGDREGEGLEDWRRTLETDTLDMFELDEQGSLAPQISRTASGNIQFGLRKRYRTLSVDDVVVED